MALPNVKCPHCQKWYSLQSEARAANSVFCFSCYRGMKGPVATDQRAKLIVEMFTDSISPRDRAAFEKALAGHLAGAVLDATTWTESVPAIGKVGKKGT